MKISFVILHYKVAQITIECINNLLNQDYDSIQIVIVDNHSDNGSIEEIQELYGNNEKLYILSIEYNVGFAKANDLGYQIAKHKFDADCIIVINNDLMIEDRLFCKKVEKVLDEFNYDILGPDIVNIAGVHQNPLKNCIVGKREVDKKLLINRIKIALIPILYRFKREKTTNIKHDNQKTLRTTDGVPLHGSCLIFSKKFLKGHEYPFFPETFLYGEEEILYYLAKKEKLRLAFDPDLKVKHMEDISTNSVLADEKKKRLFELKNSTQSLQVLKKLMVCDKKIN